MIGNTFQFAWEVKLIEWCQTNLPSPSIGFAKGASYLGDTIFLVGIMAFFYLCYDKKCGRRIVVNTLISLMFAGQIKNIFKRRRPYFDNENIECLKIVESKYDMYDVRKQGFSFPSMHSSNISTVSGTLYEYYRKKPLLIGAIVVSLLVGISRFVLGCHYPTDVLTGWILGILSVLLLGKLQDKLSDKQLYLLLIVMGIIGFFFCESADFFSSFGIALGFIICEVFDKKYINFKNTKNPIKMILRIVIACAVFLGVSEGLKLPFPSEVLEANTLFAYIYRVLRYCIAAFMGMGLTTVLYKYNLLKLKDGE